MLADLGDYWIIIAMIFIAFFRWLFSDRRRVDQPMEEDFEPEIEPQRQPQSAPPPVPARPAQEQADPAAELRRFLEQMTGQVAQPAPPPPVPKQQPPAKPAETRVELTQEEKRALERLQRQERLRGSALSASGPSPSLQALLATPDSLKKAVLLKEILDRPVAFRDLRQP